MYTTVFNGTRVQQDITYIRHVIFRHHLQPIWLVGWFVVFNVPSTARSFRDGQPIRKRLNIVKRKGRD